MNTLLIYLSFVMVGLLAMYIVYKPQCNKYEQTLSFSYAMLPMPYIYTFYAIGSICAFFLLDNNDFIEPLTFERMLAPLILTPAIYASCIFFSARYAFLITGLCIAATVWLQPIGEGNPYPEIPVWALQFIIFAIALIFCLGNLILNFIPHTFLIPQITILLGLSIMAFLGATPLYTALCAAALIGALIGYLSINFYDVKIEIDNATTVSISYMVFSLILLNIGEICLPSCLILTTVFWAELIVAVLRKFFVSNAGSLSENTNSYMAAQNLTVFGMTLNILKVCGIIMFIAWFQLYAVNSYSLVIISLFIALWLSSSMYQPNGGKRTLKEINKDFIEDLKKSIAETKEVLNKNKDDK